MNHTEKQQKRLQNRQRIQNEIDSKKTSSLVYIAGTNVSKYNAIENLKLNKFKDNHNVTVIDGVGTKANTELEKKISGKRNIPFRNIINTIIHQIKGYNEGTHLAQSYVATNAINENTKNLVLAGHSRGAAVGLTGVITQMYAEALTSKGAFLSQTDKIKIIAIDPVQGPDTNDHLGLGKATSQDSPSISEMLNTISKVAKKPDLFDVSVSLARYDARSTFKIDQRWSEFIDKNKGIKSDLIFTGFQHSDSIKPGHKGDPNIYPKNATPRDLTHALIAKNIGPGNSNEITQKQLDENFTNLSKIVEKIELNEIQNVLNGKESDLNKHCSSKGYKFIGRIIIDKSFKEDIKREGKIDGRTIKGENQIRTSEQKENYNQSLYILPNEKAINIAEGIDNKPNFDKNMIRPINLKNNNEMEVKKPKTTLASPKIATKSNLRLKI